MAKRGTLCLRICATGVPLLLFVEGVAALWIARKPAFAYTFLLLEYFEN